MVREIRLMTCGAELRSPVEALHDGPGMTVGVLYDLVVWNLSRDAVAVFIHHHGRNPHNKPAVSASGLQALYGVTDHAGQAVVIEFSVYLRIFSESAAEHADRVVTAIAVP